MKNAALLPLLITLIAGVGLPVQAALNGRLGKTLGSPFWGSLASFCIGTVSIALFVWLSRTAAPTLPNASADVAPVPWWFWLGGVIGAVFVTVAATFAARLGLTLFSGVVIAGQLLTSVVLDHFGWLVPERHPLSLTRLAGIALLAAGIALIRRG